MKAAVFKEHGASDVLEVIELDSPEPGHGEVLIRVQAFALNRLDVWTRQGMPNLDIEFPHIGGSDFAGIVEQCGEGVTSVKVGDRVVVNPTISCRKCLHCRSGEISMCDQFQILGEHQNGGAAEYAVAPATNLLPIPEDIDVADAAATALTAMTAYRMIKTRAAIRPGEVVLVTGSGGGVGTMATQIANHLGGTVIALTSSQKKMELAKKLGATKVINYKEDDDWGRTARKLSNQNGIDIVVDSAGQAVFNTAVRSLAKGGRYVTCGATTGRNGEINLAALFWKQLSILGSSMASHQEFEEVMHLFFTGKISPVIDSTYRLDEIQQAHERLENPEHTGKIVIRLD